VATIKWLQAPADAVLSEC